MWNLINRGSDATKDISEAARIDRENPQSSSRYTRLSTSSRYTRLSTTAAVPAPHHSRPAWARGVSLVATALMEVVAPESQSRGQLARQWAP